MIHVGLAIGERLLVDDVRMAVREATATGYSMIGVIDGMRRPMTHEEIAEKLFDNTLLRLDATIDPQSLTALDPEPSDFSSISEAAGNRAIRETAYVRGIFERLGSPPYADSRLEAICISIHDEIGDKLPVPCVRAVRRWIAKEPIGSPGPDPIRHIPNRNKTQGRREATFPPKVERIVEEVCREVLDRHGPDTTLGAYSIARARIKKENEITPETPLPIPSRASFYRIVAKRSKRKKIETQIGNRAARDDYDQNGSRLEKPRWPMAVVEIDHTFVDCEIVDENEIVLGRPTLTAGVDRMTGMCVGFALSWEPPSFLSCMLLLRSIARPKTYVATNFDGKIRHQWPCMGLPSSFVADNGTDLHSHSFHMACLTQGIHPEYCTPAEPKQKPHIERFFWSLAQEILHTLPGTTLSRPNRKSDYDPSKAAKVQLRQLNAILHKTIVDVHAGQEVDGRPGVTRREAWIEGIKKYPLRLPLSARDLDINTRAATRTPRTLDRHGIDLFGLVYDAQELAHLRDGKVSIAVDVRYNPGDLFDVWMTPVGEKRWMRATCKSAPNYARSRTLWQHQRVREKLDPKLKRRANEDDLLDAMAELREMAAKIRGKKNPRRVKKREHARHTHRPMTPEQLSQPVASFDEIFAAAEVEPAADHESREADSPPCPSKGTKRAQSSRRSSEAMPENVRDEDRAVDLDLDRYAAAFEVRND